MLVSLLILIYSQRLQHKRGCLLRHVPVDVNLFSGNSFHYHADGLCFSVSSKILTGFLESVHDQSNCAATNFISATVIIIGNATLTHLYDTKNCSIVLHNRMLSRMFLLRENYTTIEGTCKSRDESVAGIVGENDEVKSNSRKFCDCCSRYFPINEKKAEFLRLPYVCNKATLFQK